MPPLVAVAVGSSMRPPSTTAAVRLGVILVHCAANYRVTAFVGLYRVLCEGWAADKAFEPMRSVWEPDGVWKQFIGNMVQRMPG